MMLVDLQSIEMGIFEVVVWCLFVRCIRGSLAKARNWDVDCLLVLFGIFGLIMVRLWQIAYDTA